MLSTQNASNYPVERKGQNEQEDPEVINIESGYKKLEEIEKRLQGYFKEADPSEDIFRPVENPPKANFFIPQKSASSMGAKSSTSGGEMTMTFSENPSGQIHPGTRNTHLSQTQPNEIFVLDKQDKLHDYSFKKNSKESLNWFSKDNRESDSSSLKNETAKKVIVEAQVSENPLQLESHNSGLNDKIKQIEDKISKYKFENQNFAKTGKSPLILQAEKKPTTINQEVDQEPSRFQSYQSAEVKDNFFGNIREDKEQGPPSNIKQLLDTSGSRWANSSINNSSQEIPTNKVKNYAFDSMDPSRTDHQTPLFLAPREPLKSQKETHQDFLVSDQGFSAEVKDDEKNRLADLVEKQKEMIANIQAQLNAEKMKNQNYQNQDLSGVLSKTSFDKPSYLQENNPSQISLDSRFYKAGADPGPQNLLTNDKIQQFTCSSVKESRDQLDDLYSTFKDRKREWDRLRSGRSGRSSIKAISAVSYVKDSSDSSINSMTDPIPPKRRTRKSKTKKTNRSKSKSKDKTRKTPKTITNNQALKKANSRRASITSKGSRMSISRDKYQSSKKLPHNSSTLSGRSLTKGSKKPSKPSKNPPKPTQTQKSKPKQLSKPSLSVSSLNPFQKKKSSKKALPAPSDQTLLVDQLCEAVLNKLMAKQTNQPPKKPPRQSSKGMVKTKVWN